jgi:hypothetical protein
MAKAALNKKKPPFTSKLDLKWMQELTKCYIWKHILELCWNLDSSENRTEPPEKFWNVVVDKAGEDQLDGSCEIWGRITCSQPPLLHIDFTEFLT